MKRLSVIILAITLCNFSVQAQSWSKLGTGTSGFNTLGAGIYSICSDNHNNIYAAGFFSYLNPHQIVSKWDGSSWSRLGVGSAILDSMVEIDQIVTDTSGNVYVVGQINNSITQYVAKWDGITWSKLGSGPDALNANSGIDALCFDRYGNLYAGGAFTDTTSDSTRGTYVAKWNGASWSELGTGVHKLKGNASIISICTDTFGNIYVAGSFTDSTTANGGNLYVAKWDGTNWSELGSGVAHQIGYGDYQINSIKADAAGNIYAAGYFEPEHVMKWNGSTWSILGASSDSIFTYQRIMSICFDLNGNLYASGAIQDAAGKRFVARWNGTVWSKLGIGSDALNANDDINSLCSDGYGNIYAGGQFTDTSSWVPYDTFFYHPFYVARFTNPSLSVAPLAPVTEAIMVYPNPTNNLLNIRLNNDNNYLIGSEYSLVDCADRLIKTGRLENAQTTIDMKEITPGIYILRLAGSKDAACYKIVRE